VKKSQYFLAAASMSAAYALAMFQRASYSDVSAVLDRSGKLPPSSLAWVGSCFFWVYLTAQIPAGIAVDAFGPRRVSAAGALMMSFGSLMFGMSSTPWAFAVGRGICAAGAVCCFLALLSFCSSAAKVRRASFLGKALLVGNIGGVLAGAPLALLLEYTNVHYAWLVLSAACMALAYTCWMWAPNLERSDQWDSACLRSASLLLSRARHLEVYLAAGSLAGLAGTFHAFAGFGANQLAAAHQVGRATEGLWVSLMVVGFAVGSWFWASVGDRTAVRTRAPVCSGVACVCLWLALSLLPLGPMLVLGLLSTVGFLCGSYSQIYGLLDELLPAGSPCGAKAIANCGIALGAATIEVWQGALPAAHASIPCAAMAILGLGCSIALTRRQMFAQIGWRTLSADAEIP
jgi:MFS family permease